MQLNRYKYEELDERVREQIYNQYLEELNESCDWWEPLLEEQCLIFKQNYGLEIDPERIYFSLFYPKCLFIDSKGITIDNLFKFITQLYKDKYIDDTFRKIFLEELGQIEFENDSTSTYVRVHFYENTSLSSSVDNEYSDIIQDWFNDKIIEPLLSNLEAAYEDMTSEETMIEHFEVNGIRFDSEGNQIEYEDLIDEQIEYEDLIDEQIEYEDLIDEQIDESEQSV